PPLDVAPVRTGAARNLRFGVALRIRAGTTPLLPDTAPRLRGGVVSRFRCPPIRLRPVRPPRRFLELPEHFVEFSRKIPLPEPVPLHLAARRLRHLPDRDDVLHFPAAPAAQVPLQAFGDIREGRNRLLRHDE